MNMFSPVIATWISQKASRKWRKSNLLLLTLVLPKFSEYKLKELKFRHYLLIWVNSKFVLFFRQGFCKKARIVSNISLKWSFFISINLTRRSVAVFFAILLLKSSPFDDREILFNDKSMSGTVKCVKISSRPFLNLDFTTSFGQLFNWINISPARLNISEGISS